MGEGVIWLIVGILVLIGGALAFFRRMVAFNPANIGPLLVWLILVVFIITYAEQHDDPWQLYVTNIAMTAAGAVTGFLAAQAVTREKFASLNRRLDDHIDSDKKFFDQFEKRILEKLDAMNTKIERGLGAAEGPKVGVRHVEKQEI